MNEILSSIGTFLAGVAAILATFTWKKQLRYEKKYEDIDKLKICFVDYIYFFHSYYYLCLKELHDNKRALCENELNLKEREKLNEQYLSYLFAWEDVAYHLNSKEIKNFSFKPEELQKTLLKLLPIKNGDIDEHGFYKLLPNNNFESDMMKIRTKILFEIKNLRK